MREVLREMLIGVPYVCFRMGGKAKQVYNVAQDDYQSYLLADGDKLSVEAVLERFSNKVEIRGAVYRAGIYQLDDSVTGTVRQLISKSGRTSGRCFFLTGLC